MNGLILTIRLRCHQRAWMLLLRPSVTWAKLWGFITHQRHDGNLAWQSGSNCSGCCNICVALEKNNFRITCSLLIIAADTCLLGPELPFRSKFEKCLRVLEWQWLICRRDFEKGVLVPRNCLSLTLTDYFTRLPASESVTTKESTDIEKYKPKHTVYYFQGHRHHNFMIILAT